MHSKSVRTTPFNFFTDSLLTQSFICRFEKALKDKLIQKSNAKMSEEACLMKMFKYFDIMNVGAVDFGQF